MMANCNPMLKRVYETGFALDDVILYLDTHPTDVEALNYYYHIKSMRDEAVNNYETSFGPLFSHQVNIDGWTWNNDPWPWEGGC